MRKRIGIWSMAFVMALLFAVSIAFAGEPILRHENEWTAVQTFTKGAVTGALSLSNTFGMLDDMALTIGTTTATAATKITSEFDETTTGIGLFNMGSVSVPMVLNTNPGAAVIGETVNILHSAGAGNCDDLVASYEKIAVSGAGDSGITIVGTASRAYVGTAVASATVADECYGAQPWASHYGTGAIAAMSGLSAKVDVNTGNFTASTVNAGHFHIEGASTVTGQFDGVMVSVYADVTSMDGALALIVGSGATVASMMRISGAAAQVFDFTGAGTCVDATTTEYTGTAAGHILVKMPNGGTGYINVWTD